jgi:hypothetical protein
MVFSMLSMLRFSVLGNAEKFFLLATIFLAERWGIDHGDYVALQLEVPILMIVGLVVGVLVLRSVSGAGYFTLAYIVCVGVAHFILFDTLRAPNTGSDVLDATKEAIQVVLGGQNPYLHDFMTTRPPHSPFPYLPGEIFFYGVPFLFHVSPDMVEKCAGIGIVFLIAALAPIVGVACAALCVALYALCSGSIPTGTNDIGLAFVALSAILLLAWSEKLEGRDTCRRAGSICFQASAVFFAWAMIFKALFWPFVPFIVAYLWRKDQGAAKRYLLTTALLCELALLPCWVPWPYGLIGNVYRGFVYHNGMFWGINLWNALQAAGFPVHPAGIVTKITDNVVVIGVCLTLLRPSASLGEALMRGSGTLATALLLSQYTPCVYWAFASTMFVVALALLPEAVTGDYPSMGDLE